MRLEYFVHLDKDDPPDDRILAIAEVPAELSRERIEISDLPAGWRNASAPPELARFGYDFAKKGESPLLLIPSVVAPSENNVLINPEHPAFKKISVLEPEALSYDPRIFPSRRSRRHH